MAENGDIMWLDRVRNKGVSMKSWRGEKDLKNINKRKSSWVGLTLTRVFTMRNLIEGKSEGKRGV